LECLGARFSQPRLLPFRRCEREAGEDAGAHVISFNIANTDPGFIGTIWMTSPHGALPALTESGTTIDGQMQTANKGSTNGNGLEIVINGGRAAQQVHRCLYWSSCLSFR